MARNHLISRLNWLEIHLKKENFSFGIDIVRKEINRIYGSKHNLDIDLGLEPLHMELTLEEAEKIYEKVCKENGNKALSQLSLRKNGFWENNWSNKQTSCR